MILNTDRDIYDLMLFKVSDDSGKVWKFIFRTDKKNIRCGIFIYLDKRKRIKVKYGEVDLDYDIVSPILINHREIIKFYNTLSYSVEYFKSRNPQYLWYDCDNFEVD